MSTEKVKNKPYFGHHKRLRERFIKSGLQGFHDYELLELLLTYIFPYKDTKPIAKDLLNKFKTLAGVFSADAQELQEIKGVGERTAVYLKLLNDTLGFVFEERARNEEIQFTKTVQLFEYFKATIGNKKNEVMRAVYLDSQNRLIHAENLSEGTVAEAVAFPRKIVEGALKYRAVSVIIAHNHPRGVAEPSDNDDKITEQIKNALQTVGISLQDHLIIAGDEYFSYRQTGYLG
ncbi:MAG: DNA repair protein RadC [Candidatus Marinimicrobia bacterium]|nr:DNA repair protein RadC [Candidatus Neomarinimicrobiota bacterium]